MFCLKVGIFYFVNIFFCELAKRFFHSLLINHRHHTKFDQFANDRFAYLLAHLRLDNIEVRQAAKLNDKFAPARYLLLISNSTHNISSLIVTVGRYLNYLIFLLKH